MTNNVCPICESEDSQVGWAPENRSGYKVRCRRCGEFLIDDILHKFMGGRQLDASDKQLLPYLSAYTRQATEKGILSELDGKNWRDLARAHTTTSVSQKVTKLLELVATRSSFPGDIVLIDTDIDYPLLDAKSASEVNYLLNHLESLNYLHPLSGEELSRLEEPSPQVIDLLEKFALLSLSENQKACFLSVKGWERLEPPAGGGGIPGRCFIAMSFDPSLKDAYDAGIYLAVKEDCKLDPIRIDRIHHNKKICDKILAEIRRAQFVIADFTYHRGGVYFEAGFAMGLGRPVIWTCQEDDLVNTHFDTRQYNHIVWSTPGDLRVKLTDRIRATILK